MANIKSQIKRNRSNERRRVRNQAARSELKTRTKVAATAIDAGDEDAPEAVRLAQKRHRQGGGPRPHPQEPGRSAHVAPDEARRRAPPSNPPPPGQGLRAPDRPDRAAPLRAASRASRTTSTSITASSGMPRAPLRSRSAWKRRSNACADAADAQRARLVQRLARRELLMRPTERGDRVVDGLRSRDRRAAGCAGSSCSASP